MTIAAMRGRVHRLADGTPALATIHPSFLLRIQSAIDKQREYARFVADLHQAAALLADAAA